MATPAEPAPFTTAAGSADVFQIDAAERGGDVDDRADDLFRILGIQADGKRIDPAKFFKQYGLSLHDRHSGMGADVAKSEHRAPVGDDGYRV